MYQVTTATRKIASLKQKIRAIQGGTSSSKTISILLFLIDKAQRDKTPTLTSIVAESLPHLKRGAMRDFLNIMKTHNYYDEERWSRTEFIYTFETGSSIEFFGVDQPDKLRGARRDRLFINEANNIDLDVFDQLEVRTKEFVFLDWNPSHEFWFYTEVKPRRVDIDHIILTYKDNEALSPEIIHSIEARRDRKQWWTVYGLGQLGEIEGRIYTGWREIDTIPHEAKLERYGLDFGYTNDPTSIIAIYRHNNGFILDEVAYTKGLSNKRIAEVLLAQERKALVVADSAEPKSIDEIAGYGVSIVGAKKGADSRRFGIQKIQMEQISFTKRSHNIRKEYNNYLWRTDRDGKLVSPNEPEDGFDHTLDAIRYAMTDLLSGSYAIFDEIDKEIWGDYTIRGL